MEQLEKKKKITIMLAIMAALLFASLNQTIVGTALPRIVADLGGFEYYSWIFTIYMLTASVTSILVGKLSDIYGRKPFILIGLAIFIVGTFLNGLSENIIQLIIYRGIQGFGGGMVLSTSFTAVGDLFSPRERGRWQGILGSVFGLSSVFGPTLGGWIVDHTDWHWIFWVFLPFGVVAFILILVLFPSIERKEHEPIDYAGSFFLTFTIVPMLLAFSWAGTKYEWDSWQIIGLFAFMLIALGLFMLAEKKAKSPVLPLQLFKNSTFSLSNAIGFIIGAGMFGAIMYMPFFVQGVIGTSAASSGLITMPMTLSMVIASSIGGQLITKTGKYKAQAVIGLLIMTIGMFLLSIMDIDTTKTTAVINMIIVGFGIGMSLPIFTLTIQNAVSPNLMGVATASAQLFRQIGGTVGVAVMGTLMSTRMNEKMTELMNKSEMMNQLGKANPDAANQLAQLQNPQLLTNPDQLARISRSMPEQMKPIFEQLLHFMREALSYSLTGVFLMGTIVVGLSLLLVFFLKEVPLRHTAKEESNKEQTTAS
ncbi:MDR family MFS transporter [Bacillus alveayuensis]|uniref:MDR family MFS transporter n=1 Tax=Aeribacillus alveayuensis TaxID=279215 RepID=UPI0005D104A8|nr:MDR family MFS transporter [Bacillus alveayuensis]